MAFETGFNKKTFEQIKNELEANYSANFGVIDLNPRSVAAQNIAIYSEQEASIWELTESIVNATYPDTATGFSLDGVAQFTGVKRLDATATTVLADLVGTNQTLIPAGSEATALGVNTTFSLTEDVLITNESCVAIKVQISDLTEDEFKLTINSETFSYDKLPDDTVTIIVDYLVTFISFSDLNVTASNISDNLVIVSNSTTEVLQVYLLSGLEIIDITASGTFEALDKGQIPLPANALTTIQTPIGGWISIYNPLAGDTGRNLETDVELRIRRDLSIRLGGTATPDAIRARLLNVPGVTAVAIRENKTLAEVDGLPAKSFECLVLGGTDAAVGQALWDARGAGGNPQGNTEFLAIDTTGTLQLMRFSRPVRYYVYVKVTLTKNSLYPVGGDDLIKQRIATQINALNVGQTVVYQSLYSSVYSIAGITEATIAIGATLIELIPPFLLNEANITVSSSRIAVSDVSKITIEEA